MITYDDHGGTYDHVHPPFGAACPDTKSNHGENGFTFNRFGVRVPTILISPWIQTGTIFRSPTTTPYDHTSLLATLRDWLQIPAEKMLTSARIARAPTFEGVVALPKARTELPAIPHPTGKAKAPERHKALNALQTSLVSAYAVNQGQDPALVLSTVRSRQDAINYFLTKMTPAEKVAQPERLEREPGEARGRPNQINYIYIRRMGCWSFDRKWRNLGGYKCEQQGRIP
jgi:phospholipase C